MILLSAGHYPAAQGARYNGVSEHSLAVPWIEMLARHIEPYAPVEIVPTGPLMILDPVTRALVGGKIHWINQRTALLAVELHFNSDASRRQAGCETLYCPGSVRGREAAQFAHDEYAHLFPPDRGVKEGWLRGDRPGVVDYPGDVDGDEDKAAFLSETDPIALLVEPEFIYNLVTLAERERAALAAIARGLIKAVQFLQGGA